jgi:acetoacetyl-CoA synthetase
MWTPSQVKADWGVDCADDMDYEALHRWSVSELERFWSSVWRFCGVIGDLNETPVLVDGEKMPGARFFPEAQLNFAENLLRQRGPGDAMVFWGEDQVKRRVSHDELFDGVARLAAALKALGVGPGDRVAGFMPNLPETVMATLATASLGAIWSSCSPDFGVQGVLPGRLFLRRQAPRLPRPGGRVRRRAAEPAQDRRGALHRGAARRLGPG